MAGVSYQRVTDSQNDCAEHNDTLGAENFIAQPTTNSDHSVDQRAEGREQGDGVSFGHTQHFDQVNGHDALQAVIAKTLPQLDRENQVERFWLFESVQTYAFCWFLVCSRHIYLFFLHPTLTGVF
ncbi:hypothetical protein D3C75_807880 [compost metagenome]